VKLAIYDMDKTITRLPTYTPFLFFAARKLAPWRLLFFPVWILSMFGYLAGIYDRKKLKEIGFSLMIGRTISRDRLDKVADAFAERTLANNVFSQAQDRIQQDVAEGYRLVMATASPDYYAGPIGRKLGFDTVIATVQAELADGRYSNRIASGNCYGENKLEMIRQWMFGEKLEREHLLIRFYSDHHSDGPTFDWATEAYAINPKNKLQKLSRQKNWTVVEFR
jgi:HAD superfamily hydrolase (TIGR01490 family)